MKINKVILFNLASNFFLMGNIITTQFLIFPFYKDINSSTFMTYSSIQFKTSFVLLLIPMLIDIITSFILYRQPSTKKLSLQSYPLYISIIILMAILIQFIIFGILTQGFHIIALKSIILLNWLRVIGWSLKSLIAFILILKNKPSSEAV
tara:strand:+ start:325 stop:774 length:450 start_codon:yes stop_codon:yes gene_type:complete